MPRWIAVALATVGVLALLWIAAEQHYQSCVAHSAAQVDASASTQDSGGAFSSGPSTTVTAKITRGGGCSRLP
jgi:hypothetical protein